MVINTSTPRVSLGDLRLTQTANKTEIAKTISNIQETKSITREQFKTLSKGIEGGENALSKALEGVMPKSDIAKIRDFSLSKLFTSNTEIAGSFLPEKLTVAKEGLSSILTDKPLLTVPVLDVGQESSVTPVASKPQESVAVPEQPKEELGHASTSDMKSITSANSEISKADKIASNTNPAHLRHALRMNKDIGDTLKTVTEPSVELQEAKINLLKNKIKICSQMAKNEVLPPLQLKRMFKDIIIESKQEVGVSAKLRRDIQQLKTLLNEDEPQKEEEHEEPVATSPSPKKFDFDDL